MTNTTHIENDSRRRFLQGTAGLTLAAYLPTTLGATDAAGTGKAGTAAANTTPFERTRSCALVPTTR